MGAVWFVEPATLEKRLSVSSGATGTSSLEGVISEKLAETLVPTMSAWWAGQDHGTAGPAPGWDGSASGSSSNPYAIRVRPRFTGPYRILARGASVESQRQRSCQSGALGGNLCQRPRCLYYQVRSLLAREEGGGTVRRRRSRIKIASSIMGSHGCYSVHASDLAPPFDRPLDGHVTLIGPSGAHAASRTVFCRSERDVQREMSWLTMKSTAVTLPPPELS